MAKVSTPTTHHSPKQPPIPWPCSSMALKHNGGILVILLIVVALFHQLFFASFLTLSCYSEIDAYVINAPRTDTIPIRASSHIRKPGTHPNDKNGAIAVPNRNTPHSISWTYHPSPLESYVRIHSDELGYNKTSPDDPAVGCNIWTNPNTSHIYNDLQTFRNELAEYNQRLHNYKGTVQDLREYMTNDENDKKSICDTLELHEDGLEGIFPSGSLSRLAGSSGYLEPLLSPLRHPDICLPQPHQHLMNLEFLVHDFASMCRNNLKPTSRIVFVDMGAALDYHRGSQSALYSPAMYITQMYQRFGFHFDHIYAYEIKPKEPGQVYQQIPDDLKAAYHWYNVGVDANIESSNNPLKMLIENYREDDFVIVKLDIDTPHLEIPMAELLAKDERLHKVVDAFYFEHHVVLSELAPNWKKSMSGSVKNSLEMFATIREKGIASHYWP